MSCSHRNSEGQLTLARDPMCRQCGEHVDVSVPCRPEATSVKHGGPCRLVCPECEGLEPRRSEATPVNHAFNAGDAEYGHERECRLPVFAYGAWRNCGRAPEDHPPCPWTPALPEQRSAAAKTSEGGAALEGERASHEPALSLADRGSVESAPARVGMPAPRISIRWRLRQIAKGALDPDAEAESMVAETAALVDWAREDERRRAAAKTGGG